MARRSLSDRNIRKLAKGSSSYSVSPPIDDAQSLKWKRGKKLVVTLDKRKKQCIAQEYWERFWSIERSIWRIKKS